MINGEGTRETSSVVASPDLSPASSQYSSCGESEFERYCSANSVMGTPSMGSSSSFRAFNDCIDSEFGSVRSLGIGDDGNLENFSLDGGLDRNFETQKPSSSSGGGGSFGDRRIHYWEGNINSEHRNDMDAGKGLVMVKNRSNLCDNKEDFSMLEGNDAASSDLNMSGLLGYGNLSTVLDEGLSGSDVQDGIILNRGHSETDVMLSSAEDLPSQGSLNAENDSGNMCNSGIGNSSNCWMENEEGSQSRMVIEEVGVFSNGLNSGSDLQFDGRETGKLSEQEESLSRYEHSDDEDSMYEYGTDNEHMTDSHSKQNIQYSREVKNEGGNSLLMNSSIAFGSQDWDDFEQEMVSTNLPSVMSNKVEVRKQLDNESERNLQKFSPETPIEFPGAGGSKQGEDVNKKSIVIGGVQVADESEDYLESSSVTPSGCLDLGEPEQGEEVGNIYLASNPVRGTNESAEYQRCSVSNVYRTQLDSQVQRDPLLIGLNVMGGGIETENQHRIREEVIGLDDNQILESQELGKSNSKLDPLSDTTANQPFFPSTEEPIDEEETFLKELKPTSLAVMFENKTKRISHESSSFSADLCEDHSASIKTKNLNSNESYDDVVNEMEEILLDSFESPRVGFFQDNQIFQSHLTVPSRDGGSTASTSGTSEAFSLVQHPVKIDEIEVVGAKQKKGDVSLSERLVGVKEYTVYIIRVWSEKDQWEVERRYRDFFTLFRRLKSVFTDQGLSLPSPWSAVERESRKIFGNASPDVVAERSSLIQECLRSILHSRNSSSPPTALILFLSPQDAFPSSPASNTPLSWSTFFTRGADTENISTLGKTISLMVEIRPYKSMRQLLEAQNYTCAGCHRNFDGGKTLMGDFVQSLGWGKPRLCEYTGQLFCSSCHTNETAILPARVLHHWDFTQYPVSQLAKSYLDSIHDQPMLCVSAVNPFLFSKVQAMLHIMNVRKKVRSMLPYVRCPFRRSINKGLGSRRYLLESNDFFALRDLIDLSKGAFSALPVMIETVSRKILVHITEQCLICCDVGVPCGARQACSDPSSLIFPFQEGEIEKCKSCRSVFHKLCFRNIINCPCGLQLRVDEATKRVSGWDGDEEGALDLIVRKLGSGLPVGFLSGLFSKSRQENQQGHKDGDTVILMGSLPSTSL